MGDNVLAARRLSVGNLLNALAALLMVVANSGCAGNQQAQASQSVQTQSSPAREAYTSRITRDGCTVDLVKVYQASIDRPLIRINGEDDTWAKFAESQHPQVDLILTWYLPDETIVGTIRCHIDIQRRRAMRAALTSGQAITEQTADYIKQRHWCEEDTPGVSRLAN